MTEDVVRIGDAMLQLLRPSTRGRLQSDVVRGVHPAVDASTYPVLVGVARFQPVSATALQVELGVDRSVISRRAARLATAGLVVVGAQENDRRTSLLRLTIGGRRISDELDGRRAAAIAALVSEWRPEERSALGNLLARFVIELQR